MVEGVYSSRPEPRLMLDATIFVDAPRAERLRRIEARTPNEPSNWITPWPSAEDNYLNQIRPQDTADLILLGAEAGKAALGLGRLRKAKRAKAHGDQQNKH